MADEREATPDAAAPERDEVREPAGEARPAQAPMPAKTKKRSAFRRRDELGLVILALVLTAIVWTIARGSVIEERPPITGVRVVWERPPGSSVDVAFAEDTPRVDVVLTCSAPDYEEARRKLKADGLRLIPGPVNPNQPERNLTADQDEYDLPFHSSLLGGKSIPLPVGKVYLIETSMARLIPPRLEGPWPGGLRVELLSLEPPTFEVENVRAGLLREPIPVDEPTVDDLRLDEDLGAEGVRWIVPTFRGWTGEAEGRQLDEARAKAVEDFPEIRMKVKVYGGAERVIDHEWRWALSDYDLSTYEWRLGNPTDVGVKVSLLEGTFRGTEAELDFVQQNKGKWHFEIAIFARGDTPRESLLPTTADEVEKEVMGTVRFVTDGDPGFGDVAFIPQGDQDKQVSIMVKRRKN